MLGFGYTLNLDWPWDGTNVKAGQLVDTDKYDLVLKKEYVQKSIDELNERIVGLNEHQKKMIEYWDEKRKNLTEEIVELQRRLD